MSRPLQKPVVILAFSNATDQVYLKQLKKESTVIKEYFQQDHDTGNIELVREKGIEISELTKLLNRYKGRVCIFHFGGHASSRSLQLDDGKVDRDGLAELLSLQRGLKLVFLNGCSTQAHVKPYLEAGVPIVVATTRSIPDEEATYFADQFYHALVHEHSIREAFTSASGALRVRNAIEQQEDAAISTYRNLAIDQHEFKEMPWQLYVEESNKKLLEWKIADLLHTRSPLKWILSLVVFMGLLVALATIKDWPSRGPIKDGSVATYFDQMVNIHGLKGTDDILLQVKGNLEFEINGRKRSSLIGSNGMVRFDSILSEHKGAAVQFLLKAEGFELINRNSFYRLSDSVLDIAIKPTKTEPAPERDFSLQVVLRIKDGTKIEFIDDEAQLQAKISGVQNLSVSPIDQEGQARFKAIPIRYLGQKVQFILQSANYKLWDPNATYELSKQIAYLVVERKEESVFTQTFHIHGMGGPSDIPLENEGLLKVIEGDEPQFADIKERGQAKIDRMLSSKIGESFRIFLEAEGFELVYPGRTYQYSKNIINVIIRPKIPCYTCSIPTIAEVSKVRLNLGDETITAEVANNEFMWCLIKTSLYVEGVDLLDTNNKVLKSYINVIFSGNCPKLR